jgi:hypothetical protein
MLSLTNQYRDYKGLFPSVRFLVNPRCPNDLLNNKVFSRRGPPAKTTENLQ